MINASSISELADIAEASYRNFGPLQVGQLPEGAALKQVLISVPDPCAPLRRNV